MTLSEVERAFWGVFLGLAATWTLLFLGILVGRLRYDRRERAIVRARRFLESANLWSLPVEERLYQVDRALSRLPRSAVGRVAADASAAAWVSAEEFSGYLVRSRRAADQLVKNARRHRGEAGKWRRITALRILAQGRHPDVLDLLELALHDQDADVVGAAVAVLGSLPDMRAAHLLVQALCHERYPASRIATHLEEFPLSILELLRPLVRDPRATVRYWAATLLARYPGVPGVGDDLSSLIADPEPTVRKASIASLGRLGGRFAAPVVLEGLEDPEWIVRAYAARALADLQRADLAGFIAPLLADRQWWVRLAAKESLESMGRDVVHPLVAALDHPDAFARNGAAEVLQNLGYFDTLVVRTASGVADAPELAVLRKLTSAGSGRMIEALVNRTDPRQSGHVRELLEGLGLAWAGSRP